MYIKMLVGLVIIYFLLKQLLKLRMRKKLLHAILVVLFYFGKMKIKIGVDWMVALLLGRKVRTPQDRLPLNERIFIMASATESKHLLYRKW